MLPFAMLALLGVGLTMALTGISDEDDLTGSGSDETDPGDSIEVTDSDGQIVPLDDVLTFDDETREARIDGQPDGNRIRVDAGVDFRTTIAPGHGDDTIDAGLNTDIEMPGEDALTVINGTGVQYHEVDNGADDITIRIGQQDLDDLPTLNAGTDDPGAPESNEPLEIDLSDWRDTLHLEFDADVTGNFHTVLDSHSEQTGANNYMERQLFIVRTADDVTDLNTSNIRDDMASKFFTDGHPAPVGPVSDYNIVAILDLGVESLSDETGLTDNLNETPDISSNVAFTSGLFALTNGSSETGDFLVLRENPLNPEQVTELRYAFDSDADVQQSWRLPLAKGVVLENQNPADDPAIIIDMPDDLPPGYEFEMSGMRTTITYQDDAGINQTLNKWAIDTGLGVRLDMGDFDDLRATLDDLPPDAVVSYAGFAPHNVMVDGTAVPGPGDAPATPDERIDLSLHDLSAGPVQLAGWNFSTPTDRSIVFDLPADWDGPGEVSGLKIYAETAEQFGSGLEAYSIFIDGVHVAQYGEFTSPDDIGAALSQYSPSAMHVGNMFAQHAPAAT